jgi:hypothetical protein
MGRQERSLNSLIALSTVTGAAQFALISRPCPINGCQWWVVLIAVGPLPALLLLAGWSRRGAWKRWTDLVKVDLCIVTPFLAFGVVGGSGYNGVFFAIAIAIMIFLPIAATAGLIFVRITAGPPLQDAGLNHLGVGRE